MQRNIFLVLVFIFIALSFKVISKGGSVIEGKLLGEIINYKTRKKINFFREKVIFKITNIMKAAILIFEN